MSLPTEPESALSVSDRRIAEALQRIAQQEERVQFQQKNGRDSFQGERLLCVMRDILSAFIEHRRLLEAERERCSMNALCPR